MLVTLGDLQGRFEHLGQDQQQDQGAEAAADDVEKRHADAFDFAADDHVEVPRVMASPAADSGRSRR